MARSINENDTNQKETAAVASNEGEVNVGTKGATEDVGQSEPQTHETEPKQNKSNGKRPEPVITQIIREGASTDRPPISDAEPSMEPVAYRVPPVRRPSLNLRVRHRWPEQAGKPCTIAQVQTMINRLHTYSSRMKGVQDWDALQPDKWLPMLQSICTNTETGADEEAANMETDLTYYRSLFPPEQAAALRWPMEKNVHYTRQQLRNMLVA